MRGLELLDAGAVAVALDADGKVKARAAVSNADLAKAALAALEKAASPNGTTGIASANPDSPASVAAMKTLAATISPARPGDQPVGSGTAAAVAEAWLGAANGAKEVVYFGVGNHAVAGILRGGQPMTGARGRAPAAGWLALNPVEREDYRKIGCLEAEVAASGIVRRLIWRIKAGDRSRVQDAAGGDLSAVSLAHVLDAARAGDGVAVSVMRDTAKYLGMAAANLVAIADPEVLVLGGIMASDADLLLDPVKIEIARRLPVAMMQALTIRPALLGSDAAAIGAARLGASNTK
jgi:predicted NBD/HSP70 family sugar kinase